MSSQIEKNTQSIQIKTYNPKKCMKFSKPINKKIQKNKKRISFKTINISTLNDDGTIGKLIMPTERLFSFGMSENEFRGEQTGYTFPLCLWNRDGATKDEKIWIDKFNEIIDNCIDHLINKRDDIDREELSKKDLKKFNPLYWKKETVINKKGKKIIQNDKTQSPTLYPKIDYSEKHDSFFTPFYDKNDKEIDAKSLIDKRCFAESTIKIDSIHIGTSISLQVKLNDANIEFLKAKGKNQRFTKRTKIDPKVHFEDDEDEDEDNEDVEDSEDEDNEDVEDNEDEDEDEDEDNED